MLDPDRYLCLDGSFCSEGTSGTTYHLVDEIKQNGYQSHVDHLFLTEIRLEHFQRPNSNFLLKELHKLFLLSKSETSASASESASASALSTKENGTGIENGAGSAVDATGSAPCGVAAAAATAATAAAAATSTSDTETASINENTSTSITPSLLYSSSMSRSKSTSKSLNIEQVKEQIQRHVTTNPLYRALEDLFTTKRKKNDHDHDDRDDHDHDFVWEAIGMENCVSDVSEWIPIFLEYTTSPINVLHLDRIPIIGTNMSTALKHGLQVNSAKLQTLHLLGTKFDSTSIKTIMEGIKQCKTLHTICFNNSIFIDDAGEEFAKQLQKQGQQDNEKNEYDFSHITTMELFACYLSDTVITKIIQSIITSVPNLIRLDLGKNCCSMNALNAIGKLLSLSSTTKLETLNLALQQPPTIYTIRDFDGNVIGTSTTTNINGNGSTTDDKVVLDFAPVIDGLQSNTTLKSLYLRGNKLNDDNIEQLVQHCFMGGGTSALEQLLLTDCELSQTSMEYIFRNISSTKDNANNIKCLWLNGCQSFHLSKRKYLMDILTNGLKFKNNMILEEIYLPFGFVDYRNELNTYLDYNRGGRKLLLVSSSTMTSSSISTTSSTTEKETTETTETTSSSTTTSTTTKKHISVPISKLWPIVLQRVNTMKLSTHGRSTGTAAKKNQNDNFNNNHHHSSSSSDSRSRRATIIYYLLRQKILIEGY